MGRPPIDRFARYWSAQSAEDKRHYRRVAVFLAGFIAFGLWVSLTPAGMAFISWFA